MTKELNLPNPYIPKGQEKARLAARGHDAGKTVLRIGEVSSLLAVTGILVVESVDAQDAAPTLTPTETPQESLTRSLEGYPDSVTVQPFWGDSVLVERNPHALRPFVGNDGKFIVPGYYSERPSNLPTVFLSSNETIERGNYIGGVAADFDYVVGHVAVILRAGDPNGEPVAQMLYVTFPARYLNPDGTLREEPQSLQYATVGFSTSGTGNAMYAVNELGQASQSPITENGGTFDTGNDANDVRIIINNGEHVMHYPSEAGEQQIRSGDPVVITILRNVDQIEGLPQILGEHSVDEVIGSLMDEDSSNNLGYDYNGVTFEVPILNNRVIYTMEN